MGLEDTIQNGAKPLAKWAAFITTIGVFGGALWFIYQNVWKPKVRIINVNYKEGTAIVGVSNITGVEKVKNIYGSSIVSAGAGWGVRLAGNVKPDYTIDGNRIELIKNNLVYQTIDVAPTTIIQQPNK